jgi:hypothetical protein
LCLSIAADRPWSGRVVFDRARHRDVLRLPLDYPRINQFPEWFAVDATAGYEITTRGLDRLERVTGSGLLAGIPVTVESGRELQWHVRRVPADRP